MSNSKLFLKTLKQIGYHDADTLEETDVHPMFSEKEFIPFLEVFCSLNEHNMLTTEEIQEYSSLTAAELAELEVLEKTVHLEKYSNEDKRIETHCLYEQLTQIENHNKALGSQIELFKNHEKNLLEEKETCQTLLLNAKKKFQLYEMSIVPQAESEFLFSLQSILKQIRDLESLIIQADTTDSQIPASISFKDIVQDYLKTEEKILHCVKMFLHNNFQMQVEYLLSSVTCKNSENEELLKESLFLRKTLKEQMLNKVMSEKEVKKIENFVKNFEAVQESPDFMCHPSQLSEKLEDATKLNIKLKKREEELNLYLMDAISKHVEAQFSEISLSIDKKTSEHLQYSIKEISMPMNTLICQRARLEMLIASLHEHKRDKLESIKNLVETALNEINQEQSGLQKRKIQIEKELKEAVPKQYGQDPETSIYLSLYQILAMPNEPEVQDLCSVSLQDVMQRCSKFFEAKEGFERKNKEELKAIELMEKHTSSVEALLTCSDKDYTNWHEVEQSQNSELNKLSIKLASLEASLAECNLEFAHKEKMLETKGNLRLARNLFVYAITNKELFKKCIDSIKEAVKNSVDY